VSGGGRERLGVLLAALGATVLAVLFSGKPFHVDDPSFVEAAQHVARDPLHPLDFEVLLDDRPRPAREVFASPPGFFYFLGLLLQLGIDGERGLHIALAPFAGLLVWATARLARALGERPFLPSLLVACSPAAIVCANNVMPDMFAAATGTLGAALWLEGIGGRTPRLVGGGLLMALSAFSRYGAVAAPVGLAVLAFLRGVRPPAAWAALALAPGATFLWMGLAGGGEAVTSLSGVEGAQAHAVRALAMAAHLGLATAPPMVALCGRPGRSAPALAAGALLAGALALLVPEAYRRPGVLLSALGPASVGAALLLRTVARAVRRHGERPTDALLAVWILLSVALPVVYVHASAKYLLPALPAIALAALRVEPPATGNGRRGAIAALFLLLGLAAARADLRMAQAQRTLVESTVRPLVRSGRRVWSVGHWGFQWYAEKAGVRPFEAGATIVRGDLLAVPQIGQKSGQPEPRDASWVPLRSESVRDPLPFRTMDFRANAGFYSHAYGLLPFGLSNHPIESVLVLEAR
jgi:hypothetical protein